MTARKFHHFGGEDMHRSISLQKFLGRGGKLLLVDGWSDTGVPPKVAINYLQMKRLLPDLFWRRE
jgi:hypothetical protein